MSDGAPRPSRWYHSVWFVLVMLFFVLGPLALPLLWSSPRFSRAAKWTLTLLLVVFLVWLTLASLEIVRATLRHFDTLQ